MIDERAIGAAAQQPATQTASPIQRIDIAYSGPDAGRASIGALISQLNQAAKQGYRIDARLVT